MKKNEITVGGFYKAKVNGKVTTVRVNTIRERDGYTRDSRIQTVYDITNLTTGRKTTFRSAQKFIEPVTKEPAMPSVPSLADKLAANVPPATPPHVIVQALAGTGKTTTLVEGIKPLFGLESTLTPSPQQKAVWDSLAKSKGVGSVCFVAFNKSIATELQRRVPQGCSAMTMHSMGLKAVTAAFGRVEITDYRIGDIIAEIEGKDYKELMRKDFEMVKATEKLVQMCKMNLVGTDTPNHKGDWLDTEGFNEALDQLATHYDIEVNGSRERIYNLVPKVLESCKDVDRDRRIDFSDMIWLPIALGLSVTRYDLLLVDEAQDLNRCQQELAKMASRRLVLCGDKHQAIYGFAGADSRSMDRLEEELSASKEGCEILPLTVTRRCGVAIVEEAKKIVPQFEAHESNCEGTIRTAAYGNKTGEANEPKADPNRTYHESVQYGDMCLCRVNAPLVSQCFRFLKAGRKAEIQGRDVAAGLISTIKKCVKHLANEVKEVGHISVPDLIENLDKWLNGERDKELRKRNPNEARMIAMTDRFDCILCFTEGTTTVSEVITRIDSVFTDNRNSPGIKLSTIHKAKGLEADRVFLLEPEGAAVPHPMAKSAWQIEQEWNLRYVGITRAIKELVYVK